MAVYHELVIAGHYDLARGFVMGFLTGKASPGPAIFSRERGIRRVSLGEKMLAWTGIHGTAAHVIVDEGVAGDLIRDITMAEEEIGLKVISNRPIEGAAFGFHFKVFARVYGEQIKRILGSAPSGLKISYEKAPEEKVDPDARGVEAYTPSHEYEYSAKGTAAGRFADIYPLFGKLLEHPLVEVEEMELEYKD
ncbi:MAG: hypothetical protein KAW17_10345 [Candidatus Eisenbacteria sp.]|nr:hypothetical protein [Candidatus Eisenbacteria bacterium]